MCTVTQPPRHAASFQRTRNGCYRQLAPLSNETQILSEQLVIKKKEKKRLAVIMEGKAHVTEKTGQLCCDELFNLIHQNNNQTTLTT